MPIKKINKDGVVNHWYQINQSLLLYKFMGGGLCLLCFFLTGMVFLQGNQHPIVILEKGNEKTFFVGERRPISLSEKNIKDFIVHFIESRYNWREFDPQKILYKAHCLSTKAFHQKLKGLLGKKKHPNGKGKKVEQYVAFIRPILKGKKFYAKFDRILRVNDLPMIVPSQVRLQIVQDSKTPCNPLGLYVNEMSNDRTQ